MKTLAALHPGAPPALGILLLRIAVAAFVVLALPRWPTLHAPLAFAVAGVAAAALLLGAFTRAVAALVALVGLPCWVAASGTAAGLVAVGILAAAALASLGGGPWSVDARLFGRRVMEIGGE